MHNLWFISSDAAEREGMEMFLSQNDFAVTLFEGIPASPVAKTTPAPDIVILAIFGSNLPNADDLSKIRKSSLTKRLYLLGDSFNRMEISFLLRQEVNGVFLRPLRPLAIIRKMKDDLEENDKTLAADRSPPPPGSGGSLALGNDQFASEGWQILANQILSIADIPPVLHAQCASSLIFRLYVEKLKRRLPSSVVFFLDGDETSIKKAVLEEIQHGQWRRAPVMAIYSAGGLSEGLTQFLLHDLGLLRADEDGLIRLIIGAAVSPAQLAEAGMMDSSTAAVLQQAAVELPPPEKFRDDQVKLLQWRVRQLGSEARREVPFQIYPEDLFGDRFPSHIEIEALAQWISRKTAATGEIDEAGLRTITRHASLLPGMLESARTAEARSTEYLRQREAALRLLTAPYPSPS
ncbi:MAG: hypothetical protein JJT96_03635 [Opitutales bacterium]|nr:hypothetical protein [Opitutales bacterium]